MTRDQEQAVIRRVLDGETDAFEELVLAYQKNVYNLALRMTGNEEDAFDVSQDAFLRAYNALSGFRGDSKFSVWLYRLTSNISIDYLRRRTRSRAESLTVLDEDDEPTELDIPDERFSPEALTEKRELRRAVREGLVLLPEDYRKILTLREIGGLSYEEIAQALDLEVGTVKSRLFRARKKLCGILLEQGNIPQAAASQRGKEV